MGKGHQGDGDDHWLTCNIAHGLALGSISYPALKRLSGRAQTSMGIVTGTDSTLYSAIEGTTIIIL